jgi:hypothetical protein
MFFISTKETWELESDKKYLERTNLGGSLLITDLSKVFHPRVAENLQSNIMQYYFLFIFSLVSDMSQVTPNLSGF